MPVHDLISRIRAIGQLTAKYVYGNGMRLVKVDGSGNKFYLHTDQLGSTRVVTNASKTTVQTFSYYPFGDVLSTSGSNTDYKFNGKEYDEEGGVNLLYYGARYYDLKIGRFISLDSMVNYFTPNLQMKRVVKLLLEINPYTYVANNPVSLIDPLGLDPDPPGYTDKNGNETFGRDPNPPGYSDLNVTVPIIPVGGGVFLGMTFGSVFDANGAHPYIGGGAMLGGGVFYSVSSNSVVYGLNYGLQLAMLYGWQGGFSINSNPELFNEFGRILIGTPLSGSSTGFYIFEGFSWDQIFDFAFGILGIGGAPADDVVNKGVEEEDEELDEDVRRRVCPA